MTHRAALPLLLLLTSLIVALTACSDDPKPQRDDAPDAADSAPDADDSEATDTDGDDTDENDAQAPEDASDPEDEAPEELPVDFDMDRRLPDTNELGMTRGMRRARGLVHIHSIHSHDACDGRPRLDNGDVNEPCNLDWREGVCATRMDVMFLTDHEELAALEDFQELLLMRGQDEPVMEDGEVTAARLKCPDAHEVLVMPGGEFGVMPVGLKRHIEGSPEERDARYQEVTPERVESLKALGAVVLQAHTESRTVEELRPLGLDGFEIYNLHANIAPDIREEFLGLDPFGFSEGIAPFLGQNGPHPDLTILGFLSENTPALRTFDTLLAEGQHLAGTAGTDAHRNALPFNLRDGERTDSFRRMMRFFSQHFLIDGPPTPERTRDALRAGRFYVAFEAIGSPVGFDFHAETGQGEVAEMGEAVSLADAPVLRVVLPTIHGNRGDNPPMSVRLVRAADQGGVEVATSTDGPLEFTPTEPGAYRVEVRVNPTHLRPHLGPEPDRYLVDTIWIYGNPIYIR